MRGIPSIHLPINCLLYINYLWHLLQKFGTVVFFKLTPKFVKLLTPSLIFEFLSLVEPLFLVTYTISYSFPSLQHYQILFYKNFYTVVRILGLNRYIYIQWRLQEFCPGYSYFTLKKFRVISVYFKCFGTFQ